MEKTRYEMRTCLDCGEEFPLIPGALLLCRAEPDEHDAPHRTAAGDAETPATESPAEVLTTRAPVPTRGALSSAGSVAGQYWCVGCTAWVPNAWPCVHLRSSTAPSRTRSNNG